MRKLAAYFVVMIFATQAFMANDVVASLRGGESISGSLRGLFRLVQESSGASLEWQEVHGSLNKGHALGKFDSLLGADGDSLVYCRTKDKGDKSTKFYESN